MAVSGVANRFAILSNKLVRQEATKKPNQNKYSTNVSTKITDSIGTKFSAENVISESKEFSSSIGKIFHYISLPIKVLHRIVMFRNASKNGGSSSSFQRDKNIERNIAKVSEFLAKSQEKMTTDEYNQIKISGENRKERTITLIDESGNFLKSDNGDAKTVRGKCVCETTEIAIYRTKENQFIAVERRAIKNQLGKARVIFDPNNLDNIKFEDFKHAHKEIFEELIKPLNNTKLTNIKQQEPLQNDHQNSSIIIPPENRMNDTIYQPSKIIKNNQSTDTQHETVNITSNSEVPHYSQLETYKKECLNTLDKDKVQFTQGGKYKKFDPNTGLLCGSSTKINQEFQKEEDLSDYVNSLDDSDLKSKLKSCTSFQKPLSEEIVKNLQLSATYYYARVDLYDNKIVDSHELDVLLAKQQLDKKQSASIGKQIINILKLFYLGKIEHNDLHMHNILIHRIKNVPTPIVKIIDFGKATYNGATYSSSDLNYIFFKKAKTKLETFKRNKMRKTNSEKQLKHYPLHKIAKHLGINNDEINIFLKTTGKKLNSELSNSKNNQDAEEAFNKYAESFYNWILHTSPISS